MKLKSIIINVEPFLIVTTEFMSKTVVILFILLLSVQISGCSNKQPDLPVQDFSLIEEKTDHYSQPEENNPITDNNYYQAATSISSADVELYAAQVRQQFLMQDWSAISSEISYPITISDITYENSEDFLNASNRFGSNLNEAFLTAIENEDCVEMFCNYEGIMIGESGQIWISEVLNADFSSQGLKITAINGLLNTNSDDIIAW